MWKTIFFCTEQTVYDVAQGRTKKYLQGIYVRASVFFFLQYLLFPRNIAY